MVRVVTYHGQEAIAGLRWERKGNRPLWKPAPIAATWADRTAHLPDGEDLIGTVSLLSLLADSLPDTAVDDTVLLIFADASQDLHFAAVIVRGKPKLAEEMLFEDRESFLDYVTRECDSGRINRLATTQDLVDVLDTDLKVTLFEAPTNSMDPVRIEGNPRKEPSHRLLIAGIAGTGVAAAAVFGSMLWLSSSEANQDAVPKVAVILDRAAFEHGCLEAFAEGWPRAPGWDIVREGCATPEMNDPALSRSSTVGAVAYREYKLRDGYNGEIARRAAEAVHEGTVVELHVGDNRLFATKVIEAPLMEMESGGEALSPAELRDAAAEVFLGSARLRVTLPGGAETRVRIEMQGSLEDALSTAHRLPMTGINRLSRTGEIITLDLSPLTPRYMPRSSFEKDPT
ncbi:hypothetical protein [uncultured Ruegeria sp.]|uniref:hypothetical protein n=1 Tax=uncultured Ruegeria sp. TaxID=259304 RepID=UPI0026193A47|nr:hypothetical protein [uncultured Ruegeria sp.]